MVSDTHEKQMGHNRKRFPVNRFLRLSHVGPGSSAAKCAHCQAATQAAKGSARLPCSGTKGWAGREAPCPTASHSQLFNTEHILLSERLSPVRTRPLLQGTQRGRGTLTNGRAIQEKGHTAEHAHAEGQDERPPPAPAQGAAVAGRADEGREDEAEDRAQEPGEAVVLLGKACNRHAAVRHAGVQSQGQLCCRLLQKHGDRVLLGAAPHTRDRQPLGAPPPIPHPAARGSSG